MSGGQGNPVQGGDQAQMLQMLQQQLGQLGQSGQTPAMRAVQTNGGNWQPQSLNQARQGMNNPQQFAQQQAMMQQMLRQRQAQTVQNMPQSTAGQVQQPAHQPGVDPRNNGVLGGWNNYIG